jgi:hypothetical protein
MTKVATIDTRRVLHIVVIAAMVIATLLAMIVPRLAQAAESQGTTGTFDIGSTPPVITEVATLYSAAHGATVTQMTPQLEYAVKVTVADSGTIHDLATVEVTILYDDRDGGVDDNVTHMPANGTQVSVTYTCTVGDTPSWSQTPAHDDATCTWENITATSVQPPAGDPSGDFYFNFKPGKVATEATDWDIYVVAKDHDNVVDTWYDGGDYDMMWYGEINITGGTSPNWSGIAPGMDFGDAAAKKQLTVNYKSNGDYDAAVDTTGTWARGGGGTTTLDPDGTPIANEFSLRAWALDDYAAADNVTIAAGDCVIDATGDLSLEAGDTNSNTFLYLKLGTPFADGSYSGLITFYIRTR